MGEHTHLHHDTEDEEEALSLCDLPLNDEKESSNVCSYTRRSSSSEPPEFFEFFSDLNSEMCLAEDIIFCGKLVPFRQHSPPIQPSKTHTKDEQKPMSCRRRSESLSGLQCSVTRCNSTKTALMRNSRSLDYRRLERFSSHKTSPESHIERNSSVKSIGKGDATVKRMPKPRWFVLMFGVVKPPVEMELSDIKSRQVRRNPSTMFPRLDASKKPPLNRSPNKGSCKLLKVLSCKDHASVAVATSVCVPQV